MTTLDKIKAEIQKVLDVEGYSENARVQALALFWVLELIDKYAEQEPTDESNIEKICEELTAENDDLRDQLAMRDRFKQEPCDDAVSRQAVLDVIKSMSNANPSYWNKCDVVDREYLIDEISELPSVRPQETVTEFADRCRECGAKYGKLLKSKTGHWSRKTKVDAYDIAGVKTWGIKCQCDKCDFTTIVVEDFGYYKFCPNCGAKMVKPQESEDKE